MELQCLEHECFNNSHKKTSFFYNLQSIFCVIWPEVHIGQMTVINFNEETQMNNIYM